MLIQALVTATTYLIHIFVKQRPHQSSHHPMTVAIQLPFQKNLTRYSLQMCLSRSIILDFAGPLWIHLLAKGLLWTLMNLIQNFKEQKKDTILFSIHFRLNYWQTLQLRWRLGEVIPSLTRTEESGEEGTKLVRGLFSLGTGRGLWVGGVEAGSIFQGETLSGRGMVEFSSHRTLNQDI